MAQEIFMNETISVADVRVIGSNNEQIGIMTTSEALNRAYAEGLDLIMVSPTANPPVCRICDYGKYKYDLLKKEKESKKKQKTLELKEIKFGPNIGEHDLYIKQQQAYKFLEKGHRVKISITFKGRELAFVKNYMPMLNEFVEGLASIAKIDKPVKFEGRALAVTLAKK